MALVTFTDANFASEVKKGAVLVDFWAPWCGPCRMLGPIIEQIAGEMTDVKIGKLNVDENPATSEKYEVASIPTILLFKDGEVIANRVGAATKETIKEWITSSLKDG